MASWMIHLRIADQLTDRIKDLDETSFIMGNIAPDSGVPSADWTVYNPPKSVSHYKTKREDETFFDIHELIVLLYVKNNQIYCIGRKDNQIKYKGYRIVRQRF